MSLYQKYRPKDFNSIIWQEFVSDCLKNALRLEKTVWAYLLVWSRWVGKTSVARILAKWFNCLNLRNWNPCLECENCLLAEEWNMLDMIEIDAASNTWVDNIRDLIEKAQFQPNIWKYKVYIIDEVHMLSKWAFNALLKILEEPPTHVKFILATTESEKVLETIISRTQRYDFKRIGIDDITKRLEFVAKAEKIKYETNALKFIAKLAKWWLRDALSLFEQYSSWNEINLEWIQKNLWFTWNTFIDEFIKAIVLKDKKTVFEKLNTIKDNTVDIRTFFEETIYFLWDELKKLLDTPNFEIYFTIFQEFEENYRKLKFTPDPFLLFELMTLKLINNPKIDYKEIPKPILQESQAKSEQIKPTKEKKKEEKLEEFIEQIFSTEEIKKTEKNDVDFSWNKLIEEIKKVKWKAFIGMSMLSSKYEINWNSLIIKTSNKFHFDKLDNPDIKITISKIIEKLFNKDLSIEIT